MSGLPTLGGVSAVIVDCEHKTAPTDPDGEYFAVGTPAMRGNKIDYAEARRINVDTFESWTRRLRPKYGDLLLAREAPVGPVVMIPPDEHVAPGQRTVLIRPTADRIDAKYLYYLLSSPVEQYKLQGLAEGSTVPHLNVADLRVLTLPVLPSLSEQRAISELLGALDDKIESNRKLAATADDLSAAIVRAACDPGRVDRLGDVAEINMGSSPKGETMNEDGDGAPFYQGVRDFGLRFPARRVWTTAPIRSAAAGDILVSVRAPVGTVNYAPESLCIGRGLAAVRSRTGQQSTLFHLLQSVSRSWAEYDSGGTVFGSINRDQLHNIEIPAVRSNEIQTCEAEASRLESRLAAALRENAHLAELRDTLLPKLMSGQLRVREAERLVATAV